jgi:hypothetical protein
MLYTHCKHILRVHEGRLWHPSKYLQHKAYDILITSLFYTISAGTPAILRISTYESISNPHLNFGLLRFSSFFYDMLFNPQVWQFCAINSHFQPCPACSGLLGVMYDDVLLVDWTDSCDLLSKWVLKIHLYLEAEGWLSSLWTDDIHNILRLFYPWYSMQVRAPRTLSHCTQHAAYLRVIH